VGPRKWAAWPTPFPNDRINKWAPAGIDAIIVVDLKVIISRCAHLLPWCLALRLSPVVADEGRSAQQVSTSDNIGINGGYRARNIRPYRLR
jgi:hypothetical protein